MKITTKQFGEFEFTDEQVLIFNNKIFGFENLLKFVLIKTDNELFYWLNSIEQPEICFPLVGLRLIDEKYPVQNDHEAFGIVTLNQNPLLITVNMKAPVYINHNAKTGFQATIDSDEYVLNYKLFTE